MMSAGPSVGHSVELKATPFLGPRGQAREALKVNTGLLRNPQPPTLRKCLGLSPRVSHWGSLSFCLSSVDRH